MKWINLFLIAIFIAVLFSCHGKSSKDYDKDEKNDPTKIDVPSNKDATNPSLADTANSKRDSTIKK
jgi:hypothetical protein